MSRLERRILAWTQEHKKAARTFHIVVLTICVLMGAYNMVIADSWWLAGWAFYTGTFAAAGAVMVQQWRRADALDELRDAIIDQTGDRGFGNIAWLWSYNNLRTSYVREIVHWLRTHPIAGTHFDDMPQTVRALASFLQRAQ